MTDDMTNGDSLREDYREALIEKIKRRYLVFKILGAWLMIMGTFSCFTMVKNYLFDESFKSGLFQFMPIRICALVISLAFIFAIIFGGVKLFSTAAKIQKAAENGDFIWKTGRLTNKKIYMRRNRTMYFLCFDDVNCTPIGLSYGEFNNALLGDEYIVICFEKYSLNFALKAM